MQNFFFSCFCKRQSLQEVAITKLLSIFYDLCEFCVTQIWKKSRREIGNFSLRMSWNPGGTGSLFPHAGVLSFPRLSWSDMDRCLRDELNSGCRCTGTPTRRPTSFTTSTPGELKAFTLWLQAHVGIERHVLIVNLYAFVYQGGVGAEPSWGSQRCAPTCSVGKTRTTAGKLEHLNLFLPLAVCPINPDCLVPPEGFPPHSDDLFFQSLQYILCLHPHWACLPVIAPTLT